MEIFLSHTEVDRPIAEALRDLLNDVFEDRVTVVFSTDVTPGGGVQPGTFWFKWITDKIKKSDRTYVLLTPNSTDKPWVLWEAGAATGLALAKEGEGNVVPVTFGLGKEGIPDPYRSIQYVIGDAKDPRFGIVRLLQEVNGVLKGSLSDKLFKYAVDAIVPRFLESITSSLHTPRKNPIFDEIGSIFDTGKISGFWATCFRFHGGKHHVDISRIVPQVTQPWVRITNSPPTPRTEGHERKPFCNEIEARIANRHLIGDWRNVTDSVYFGSLHLAILLGEDIMEGFSTSYSSEFRVSTQHWKWTRIHSETIANTDLQQLTLRDPSIIGPLLLKRAQDAGPVELGEIVETK